MTTSIPVTHDPFAEYTLGESYDELFDARAQPRRPYKRLYRELMNLTPEELGRSKQKADLSFFNQGITFTVYGRKEGTERIFPHDLIPRIISGSDWDVIERGLQRPMVAQSSTHGYVPRPELAVGSSDVSHDVERTVGSGGSQLVTVQRRSIVTRPESSIRTWVWNHDRHRERFERTRVVLPQEVLSLSTPDNSCPQRHVAFQLALEPGTEFSQAWQLQMRVDCVRRGPTVDIE